MLPLYALAPLNLPAQVLLKLGCDSEKLLYSCLFAALITTLDTRCLPRLSSCGGCGFDLGCTFWSGVTDFGKQFIQQMEPSSKPWLTALHVSPTYKIQDNKTLCKQLNKTHNCLNLQGGT
jgi:hypothetical protein